MSPCYSPILRRQFLYEAAYFLVARLKWSRQIQVPCTFHFSGDVLATPA